MNRRRFLQALFAVPCLGAPLLVPTVVEMPRVVFESGWLKVPVAEEYRVLPWATPTQTYWYTWTGDHWAPVRPYWEREGRGG